MPVNFEQLQEEEDGGDDDDESRGGESGVGSSHEGEEDELDGDALLLQLAAQDEIWRTQVIEFLEDVIEKLDNPEAEPSVSQSNTPQKSELEGASSALSSELGSFLFGDRMTKVLMLNHKPQALPPDEITALLFDLSTNVSTTVPDQIQALDSHTSVKSTLVPFIAMKKPSANSNVMLAARFLLDDVLPVWLKTFRPLPWEQRRVLWPLDKSMNGDSITNGGGSTRSDDSMTLDSFGTRQSPSVSKRKVKNLREQIEDQELDVETRSETCFLVTFYFAQQLLPQLMNDSAAKTVSVNEVAFQAAKSFVKEYGAYLRLHTCIAYAAAVRAHDIIKVLLEVGNHDPFHQESIRRFSRASSLVFYEPSTLSAVVERLHNLRSETNKDQRLVTVQLCASAYPDVRPWQVDRECRGLWRRDPKNGKSKDGEVLKELYYKYLTFVLHPTDGHEAARADTKLVTEWSQLSARGCMNLAKSSTNSLEAKEKKKNFFSVASKASSDHLAYKRDLTALLGLSMELKEYLLALDLATEILDDPMRAKRKSLFNSMMATFRTIGCGAIESFRVNDSTGQRTLKRILRLFQRAHGMGSDSDPWVVDAPKEIVGFLNHAAESFGEHERQRLIALVEFLSREAVPKELLLALVQWSSTETKLGADLYHVLRTALQRGASDNDNVVELSNALRRVRQARVSLLSDVPEVKENKTHVDNKTSSAGLWKKMSRGALSLAK